MKIGIYHHTFMHGSGIDNVIKEIADRLAKNNDVEINTFFCDRKDCKAKINILSKIKQKSVFAAYNPFLAIRTIKTVKKYDVVLSHIYPMNALVSIGSKIYNVPHISYFWGAPPSEIVSSIFEKGYYKFLHMTENIVPKFVTLALAPNEFIKQRNHIKKGMIFPMHSVDFEKFALKKTKKQNLERLRRKHNIPKDAKVLFAVGRVTPYKGIDLLIKILDKARKKYPNTYLIIGGSLWDEKYVNYLKSIAEEHTKLIGLVPEKDIADYYALCDIFVSASKWEGQLCSEPFALAKPQIVFDIGVNKYTIQNNKNGYLIKCFDEQEFANKVIYLLKNPSLSKKMGKNGYLWVRKNLNYDIIAEKFEKIIKGAVNKT